MRSAGFTSSCVLCFIRTDRVMMGSKFRRRKGRWEEVNDLLELWRECNFG